MHPNESLIHDFYRAFQRRDGAAMAACYHPDARFADPVFTDLRGAEPGAMWRMLCGRAKDLEIAYDGVTADDARGAAHWVARYTSAGSVWIRELYRLRTEAKVVPNKPPEAQTEQQRKWDEWVEARAQMDKWLAEQEAAKLCAQDAGQAAPNETRAKPRDPGDAPEDLVAALPPPPPFYAAVKPMAHWVMFEDTECKYEDNVTVPHKVAAAAKVTSRSTRLKPAQKT